jgi:S1-C subfamily serine protease
MFGSNSGGAIMARIILPFLRIVKLTRLTTLGTIAAAMNLGSSNFVDHALAQSSYCVSLTNAYSRALQEANSKDVIRTARELLQFCQRELIATNDYGGTLAILASALSRDGQPNEAVLVAERCLQLKTDSHLECLFAKGEAYFGMRRYEDARQALNQAIKEPALTDVDEKAKQAARRILLQVPPVRAETPKITPKARAAAIRHYGTGFFVSADGHVITNFHVTAGCQRIETRDGAQLETVGKNRQLDLALLRVDGAVRKPAVSFRGGEPVIGEQVVAFGFPLTGLLSSSGNVTTGVVSAGSGLRDNPVNFQISAPVQPGNSGGPLFDQYGNVIGIVVSKLDAAKVSGLTGDIPQNVNFAIKVDGAIKFLQQNGVSPVIGSVKEPLRNEEIAFRAKSIALQLVCLQ